MNNPDDSNNQQTNALISVPPPASQSLVTTNHPTDIGSYYGVRAYPSYRTQQGRTEGGAAWVFNIGNNLNIKGKQRVGSIRVGNTCNGASLPIKLPQNGRFIFNAGGNTNEGDLQEVASIEFGNARRY